MDINKNINFIEANSDTLIIVFSGLQGGFHIKLFEFYKMLKPINCSKLFLKDANSLWYLKNEQEIIELLQKKSHTYKKILLLGASAGGFAALKFQKYINTYKTIVFGPQTILTKEWLSENEDLRWLKKTNYINNNFDKLKLDVNNYISKECKIDIHYCKNHKLDTLHANRIFGKKFEYNCSIHSVAKYLKNECILFDIINREII